MLHGRHVIDALGHHPGQFLEAREAVEFERIKLHILHGVCLLRSHLALGLNFNFADLVAQPDDVFGEFQQRYFNRTHFAFDTCPRNCHFTGFIDQFINQIGAYAQMHLGAGMCRSGTTGSGCGAGGGCCALRVVNDRRGGVAMCRVGGQHCGGGIHRDHSLCDWCGG